MAVYGYIRVSHEESKKSGLSVAGQRDAIERYCDRRGLGQPQFFIDEAVSAWKIPFRDRPAGGKLSAVLQPGDTVIFYRLDRGFRSLLDFVKTVPAWVKAGYNVVLLDQNFDMSTANGALFVNVMAAYAQWKSDMISDRTKAGLARKKAGIASGKRVRQKWEGSAAVRPVAEVQDLPFCSGRVFSYSRVSHVNSVDGMSLDAQRDAIDDYIEWKLPNSERAEHFEDRAVSAYSNPLTMRPAGSQLNEVLQRGDHVVFARLDRVWRSTLDMAITWQDWKRRGITVHFTDTCLDTSTASGEALMEMLAVFAKWEAADMSERIKAAMDRAKIEGRAVNQSHPVGFKVVRSNGRKYLTPDEVAIRDMWHIHHMSKHGMKLDDISDYMENVLAEREGRRPLPRHGISKSLVRKYYGDKKPARRQSGEQRPPTKSGLVIRQWNQMNVHRAIKAWPQLQQTIEGLKP